MRQFTLVLAIALIAGLATSVMAQGTQLDISGAESGLGYNYDGYISTNEHDMALSLDPPADYGMSRRYTYQAFGEHSWGLCPLVNGQVSYADGVPADGVMLGADGVTSFQLSTTLDNMPGGGYPVPLVGTNAIDTLGVYRVDNIVAAIHSRGTNVPNANAIEEVVLPAAQQAAYNDLNFVITGSGDNIRIYANYNGEGTGTDGTLIYQGSVGTLTGGPAGGATTDIMYVSNEWGVSGNYESIRAGDQWLMSFTQPLLLDPTKVLTGFTIYADDFKWTGTSTAVYAATAYPVSVAGSVDAAASTVNAAPTLIADDSTAVSVITIVCKDAAHNRVTGFTAADFAVNVTGAGSNPTSNFQDLGNGVYTFDLVSDTPGTKTVDVTADVLGTPVAIVDTADVEVYNLGTPVADLSTASIAPLDIPDNGAVTATLTIELKNAGGDAVTGEAASLAVTPDALGIVDIGTITETGTGVYEAVVTGTFEGTAVLTIDWNGTVVLADTPSINVYVPVTDPDVSTVVAAPLQIPDDESISSIVTIELKDAGGNPLGGRRADLTILEDLIPTAIVVTETATAGTYEAAYTSTTPANPGHIITVVVNYGLAGEVTLTDQPEVIVSTPGFDDYPLADANGPYAAEDADGNSRETIMLDASGSTDTTGIVDYKWVDDASGKVIYQGPNAIEPVDFLLGSYNLTLTVEDGDNQTHADTTTVTVTPPAADDSVQLDIASAFNYDGHVSLVEAGHAPLYDPREDYGLTRRMVWSVFTQHGLGSYGASTMPWQHQVSGWADGIPSIGMVHTTYGTFVLSTTLDDAANIPVDPIQTTNGAPFTPPQIWDSPRGVLPLASNMIYTNGVVEVTLPVGQQTTYDDMNLLMTGQNNKVAIYANYAGEGTGIAGTLLWVAPALELDPIGDPGTFTQTGIPNILAAASDNPEVVEALFVDNVWGQSGDVSAIRTNDTRLWTFATPLALDPSKTLVGFTVEGQGGTIGVLAASAHEGSGVVPEIDITATLDFPWTYTNAPIATAGQNKVVLTVEVLSGPAGDAYSINLGEDGGAVTNFVVPALPIAMAGATEAIDIAGGQEGVATASTAGDPSYTINVTVTGAPSGKVATEDVEVTLRPLGDINGDLEVKGDDKLELNRELNSLPVTATARELDLSGDGAATGADKLIINRVLNLLPIL